MSDKFNEWWLTTTGGHQIRSTRNFAEEAWKAGAASVQPQGVGDGREVADCECGLKIWLKDGHWVDSGGDRGDEQHRHEPEPVKLTPLATDDSAYLKAHPEAPTGDGREESADNIEGGEPEWNVEGLLRTLMAIRDDFEMDYVYDGKIVDNPPFVYVRAYRLAKDALKNARSAAIPAPPSKERTY